MRSLRSSGKGWKAAVTCPAVLMVIVLQALALGAAWPQEAAPPRIDEEVAKQEKIYSSRGVDVPDGYITGRTLLSYLQVLPSGFCDALGRLGSSDRWLDIGAGAGQAILEYYAPEDDSAPGEKCSGAGGKVRAVAISIEDRRTAAWRRQAARLGDGRMQYLSGKHLQQYSSEELGKFQIITDVYGGFSYTEDLSVFMEKTLSLLEIDGTFYTVAQSVHLEDGKDKPDTEYLTRLVDLAGRDVKVCSWLKKTACVNVTCESKSDWQWPTEQIKIRKVCSGVSVPRLKLLKYEAGSPPERRFELEP